MIKLQNKLQKIYHADYNLLIAQDLQQTHYQILPIIFLKEFIKLNVNNKHEKKRKKRKKIKLVELNIDITTLFLNTQNLKMI